MIRYEDERRKTLVKAVKKRVITCQRAKERKRMNDTTPHRHCKLVIRVNSKVNYSLIKLVTNL